MIYQAYFDEEAYNKARKQHKKAQNKAIKAASILQETLNPHRFIDEDSIYGQNDIPQLVGIGKIDITTWPTPAQSTSTAVAPKISALYLYEEMFNQQIYQYMQHAISEHGFKSYDDIKNAKNLIDISKEYPVKDDIGKPPIEFTDEDISLLQKLSDKAFLLCFDECAIKLTKKRYLYCKLTEHSDNKKAYTYEIQLYAGDNRNWIFDQSITATFKFKQEIGTKLPMDIDITNSLAYEEFITMYINELNWTEKQKTFWLDMLSTYPLEDITLVKLIQPELCLDAMAYVPSQAKLNTLITTCKEIDIEVQIVATDVTSVKADLERHISKSIIPLFLKTVCAVNLKLQTCTKTQTYQDSLPTDRDEQTMYYKEKNDTSTRTIHKLKIQCPKEQNIRLPEHLTK